MEPDFKSVMSKQTNSELVKIVTVQRSDYQPKALEAAEAEIKVRGITVYEFERLKTSFDPEEDDILDLENQSVHSFIRALNFVVDMIATSILFTVIEFFMQSFLDNDDRELYNMVGYPLWAMMSFGYFVFSEYKFQKTIGKYLTGTVVIKSNGGRPLLGDIVARTFCRLIPFDGLTFLFSPNGIHDRFSDTKVVYESKKKQLPITEVDLSSEH